MLKALIFPQRQTIVTTKNKEMIIVIGKSFYIILFYALNMEKGRMKKKQKRLHFESIKHNNFVT